MKWRENSNIKWLIWSNSLSFTTDYDRLLNSLVWKIVNLNKFHNRQRLHYLYLKRVIYNLQSYLSAFCVSRKSVKASCSTFVVYDALFFEFIFANLYEFFLYFLGFRLFILYDLTHFVFLYAYNQLLYWGQRHQAMNWRNCLDQSTVPLLISEVSWTTSE